MDKQQQQQQQQQSRLESPSLSSHYALCDGSGFAGAGEQSTAAGATAAGYRSTPSRSSSSSTRPSASGAMLDNRLAPRPTRSWDTAFQTNISSSSSSKKSSAGNCTSTAFRMDSSSRLPASTEAAEARAAADADVATASTGANDMLKNSGGALTNKSGMMGASYGRDGAVPANGADFRRNASIGAGETAKSVSAPATASRAAGAATSDDDLTDTDEGVMLRLAEFTEMARQTAAHNEDLSHELAAEKRRVAHSTRKLEQSHITCTELRESLALAQDTVVKLREHEMAWAESTASEMSLRSEMCALKDEYASVSGDASVLRKRCDVLQRENAELGERFAAMAEEKRQMETKARRLLRSDRYRGY